VVAELSASADAAQQGAAGLEARKGEFDVASGELERQLNAAAIAGRHAATVAGALRYPVRFLTGL
jgi:hypothetical protein